MFSYAFVVERRFIGKSRNPRNAWTGKSRAAGCLSLAESSAIERRMRRNLDLLVSLVLVATIAACSGGSDGRPPTTVAGHPPPAPPASPARGPAPPWRPAPAGGHPGGRAPIPGLPGPIVHTGTANTTHQQ